MDSVASCCSAPPVYRDFDAITQNSKAVNLTQVTGTLMESKDISLLTDEGDKVTISYEHQSEMTYANLKAMAYSRGFFKTENQAVFKETLARLQGEAFGFEDSRELAVTIDGELNEQEMKDIQAALEGIDEIMTHLMQGGDITEAMAEASELRDLETIAGLDADYRYEKTVLVQSITIQESETYSEHGTDPHFLPDRPRGRIPSFMKLVDKMEKWVEKSQVKPSKFSRPLQRLFGKIHQGLKGDMPINKAKMHVADLIGSELMKRIEQWKDQDDPKNTPKKI